MRRFPSGHCHGNWLLVCCARALLELFCRWLRTVNRWTPSRFWSWCRRKLVCLGHDLRQAARTTYQVAVVAECTTWWTPDLLSPDFSSCSPPTSCLLRALSSKENITYTTYNATSSCAHLPRKGACIPTWLPEIVHKSTRVPPPPNLEFKLFALF